MKKWQELIVGSLLNASLALTATGIYGFLVEDKTKSAPFILIGAICSIYIGYIAWKIDR